MVARSRVIRAIAAIATGLVIGGASTYAQPQRPAAAVSRTTSARASAAVIVYSQPPGTAGVLLQSSSNGTDYDQYVWDNFTLASSWAISEVRWRGGYDPAKFGSGGAVTDFVVSIYASLAGGSQPDLANRLAQFHTGGSAGETLAGTFGGTALFDYAFILPTPFQAAAGTIYWLQIQAPQSGIPDWGIAAGTGGDGKYFRRIAGAGDVFYQIVPGDAAFALVTASADTSWQYLPLILR